eukprot:Nk52_evm34s1020 gene=Nk52_evmTU34s1020
MPFGRRGNPRSNNRLLDDIGGDGYGEEYEMNMANTSNFSIDDDLEDVERDANLPLPLHQPYTAPRRESEPQQQRRDSRKGGGFFSCLCCCCIWLGSLGKRGKKEYKERLITIGVEARTARGSRFPPNVICNQKYNVVTFIFVVLYEQFKFFFNLYFLIVACTQFIPPLKIGYLYTYWGPLIFVLTVTIVKEALDEIYRYRRDQELNSCRYQLLTINGLVAIPSSDIRVGHLIVLNQGERVPADMILLRTTEKGGASFVKTDQLDGETDWKLRIAVPSTQKLGSDRDLLSLDATVFAEAPRKAIYDFVGRYTQFDSSLGELKEPLSLDNTLWANTVVASGKAIGLVIYTGAETRSVMNTSTPHTKTGLLDTEMNRIAKVLVAFTATLSFVLVAAQQFVGLWYIYLVRFILLFSYIIPISLRVNLDMAKTLCSWMIERDDAIPDTIVRTSTIPEELGRIQYLLSDKTGTLTQNDMIFKRLHMGTVSFGCDAMDDVMSHLSKYFMESNVSGSSGPNNLSQKKYGGKSRSIVSRVSECVKALALCHNVTPCEEEGGGGAVSYQASSPDEVALVGWTESVGLTLIQRDLHGMELRDPHGSIWRYEILEMFPFTSETKRMGIIIRDLQNGELTFYMKGADVVMGQKVESNDWLEEECGNMAREGLRTLVVGRKSLTEEQYKDFSCRLTDARNCLENRDQVVQSTVESLEVGLELLGLTGVEDKLQEDVKPTLELMRNAGIKVWMLTGDKLETAQCIAVSSRLVSRSQSLYVFEKIRTLTEAQNELSNFRKKTDCALIIDGVSLTTCLANCKSEFIDVACMCPAVVCCRCSPTQKADVVGLIQSYTGQRTCAIGDGGNDVSMIQAADVGVGIVGKEGRQASLAADFSITQFRSLGRLLMWHGRNSYNRSAVLGQFVIHRGLFVSILQAIFSALYYYSSVYFYQGFLMVGYATLYTMMPVFSLTLDEDVSGDIAMLYPELYKTLTKGRALNWKTFCKWTLISVYQGGVIVLIFTKLLSDEQQPLKEAVMVTFTALLMSEWLMVALCIHKWHWFMIVSLVFSFVFYVLSLVYLTDVFDFSYLSTVEFYWKSCLLTAISCLPWFSLQAMSSWIDPPSYAKLQ